MACGLKVKPGSCGTEPEGHAMKQVLCLALVLATGCTTWQKLDHREASRIERADLVGKKVKITRGSGTTEFEVSWVRYPRVGGRDSLGDRTFDLTTIQKLEMRAPFENSLLMKIVVYPLLVVGVLALRFGSHDFYDWASG